MAYQQKQGGKTPDYALIISTEEPDCWEVKYSLQYGETEYPENQLFKTKEELLLSL